MTCHPGGFIGMYSRNDRSASKYSVIGLMPLMQECNHIVARDTLQHSVMKIMSSQHIVLDLCVM